MNGLSELTELPSRWIRLSHTCTFARAGPIDLVQVSLYARPGVRFLLTGRLSTEPVLVIVTQLWHCLKSFGVLGDKCGLSESLNLIVEAIL